METTFSVSTHKFRTRYIYILLLAWDLVILLFSLKSFLYAVPAAILMLLLLLLFWHKSEYKMAVEEDGLLFVEGGRKRKLPWQSIREMDFPDYSNLNKMGSSQKVSPKQMFIRIDRTALLEDAVEDRKPKKMWLLREDGWVNLSLFSSFSRENFKSAVEANTSKKGLFPEQPYTQMPELNVYKIGSDEKNEIKAVVAGIFVFFSFVFSVVWMVFSGLSVFFFFVMMVPVMFSLLSSIRCLFRQYQFTLSHESICITYDAGTVCVDATWDNVVSVARSANDKHGSFCIYIKTKCLEQSRKTEFVEKTSEEMISSTQLTDSLYGSLDWAEFVTLVAYFSKRDLVEKKERSVWYNVSSLLKGK